MNNEFSKVFVLTYWSMYDNEDKKIIGVFETAELAEEKYKKDVASEKTTPNSTELFEDYYYDIDEFEVQSQLKEDEEELEDSPFNPDWVSRPSHTIKDCLEHYDLTEDELQDSLEMTDEEYQRFINDEIEINLDIAIRLSNFLKVDKQFWLNRYNHFFEGLKAGKKIV